MVELCIPNSYDSFRVAYLSSPKKTFAKQQLCQDYVHQMSLLIQCHVNALPKDVSTDNPSYACLRGNMLEAAADGLSDVDSTFEMTNGLFKGIASLNASEDVSNEREVIAIGAACAFLHVTFNTLPLERMMIILAYRTTLVTVLWNFMKWSHETQNWVMLAKRSSFLLQGAPGWLLPLAVFCPVYKHVLMIVDNEEFYEQEKPLALKDIRYLIVILRQGQCCHGRASHTVARLEQPKAVCIPNSLPCRCCK